MGVAAPLSLAATGLGAAASIFGGAARAQADTFLAQQAENAASIGKTQAAQTSAFMTQDLDRQIQNIQAIRASANVESDSPTGEAIVNSVRARGQQQIGIKVGNILNQAASDQAAQFYTQSASDALIGGLLGGAGGLAKGLAGGPFYSPTPQQLNAWLALPLGP